MITQTPTQIATEKVKLCKEYERLAQEEGHGYDTYVRARELPREILAYRNAWENELEFLKEIMSQCDLSLSNFAKIKLSNRISQLNQALKI